MVSSEEAGLGSEDESVLSVQEAKTHLSQVLRDVESGRTVVIRRGSQPIARVVAYTPPPPPSMWGDIYCRMADDFDAPLDDFSEYS